MSAIGPTLEAFFIERLVGQRRASPHTIASYRDTFRLLISFAAKRCRRPPWQLNFDDLDAEVVGTFLDYLETERHNSVRTRNVRLVAIRSFFSFAALRHPEHAGTIGRVLAISPKRYERNLVTYLTATEIEAVIDACDTAKWVGRRDRAMLLLAVETGLRVSELIGLSRDDVVLEHGAHIHVVGKGRKERRTPLSEGTVAVLRVWIAERRGAPSDPLFPTSTGDRERVLSLAHQKARERPHAAPQLCDAAVAGWQRHHRHRALAWSRAGLDNEHLPPCGHDPKGAGACSDHLTRREARSLSSRRPAARLPRSAVIMPTNRSRSPPLARTSSERSA